MKTPPSAEVYFYSAADKGTSACYMVATLLEVELASVVKRKKEKEEVIKMFITFSFTCYFGQAISAMECTTITGVTHQSSPVIANYL